jgi:imidazolonepropionase-like amidohydrolase
VLIHAARLINGRGLLLTNATVDVRDSSIVAVDRHRPGPYTHDLGDVTLLPGLIDVHVHLDWHFGPNGHYGDASTAAFRDQAIVDNARATLLAGFTTIQSVGWHGDVELRARIASGAIAGPRIVTSLDPIYPRSRQDDTSLRHEVSRRIDAGADLIKVFASGSIRDGGRMNVTAGQLVAVCDEAKAHAKRVLVHAHDTPSIVAAVNAGCTEIEHGMFADAEAIEAMRWAGVRFDPNIGLVLQNYLERKSQFLGAGNFTDEGFTAMEAVVPRLEPLFRQALAAGLSMPLGTDAVAGAHGQNAREIIARAAAGQTPMDAITSATSLAAESIDLGSVVGTLAAGYEADIIAVDGDPLVDIQALRRVVFVMKGGTISLTQ